MPCFIVGFLYMHIVMLAFVHQLLWGRNVQMFMSYRETIYFLSTVSVGYCHLLRRSFVFFFKYVRIRCSNACVLLAVSVISHDFSFLESLVGRYFISYLYDAKSLVSIPRSCLDDKSPYFSIKLNIK